MWIMLTTELPVQNAPPKMAIFWSTPWPHETWGDEQKKKCQRCGYQVVKRRGRMICECDEGPELLEDEDYMAHNHWGAEPNWTGARKITYHGVHIRVFPHEYSVIENESMRLYALGDDTAQPSHFLQADSIPEEHLIVKAIEGDDCIVRDAALVDGANDQQALMTALGMNVAVEDEQIPKIGWYLLRRGYANYFGVEHPIYETQEHD